MSQTLYILVSEYSEYDEHEKTNICSSLDENKIQARMTEEIAKHQRLKELSDKADEFLAEWDAINPCPSVSGYMEVPRWDSGLSEDKITPAMRAERNTIKSRNERLAEKQRRLKDDHNKVRAKAAADYIRDTLGVTDEDMVEKIMDFDDDDPPSYSVEEVEFI